MSVNRPAWVAMATFPESHALTDVLVVDDEPEVLELLAEYFRTRGLRVATAADGRAAIAALERDSARHGLIVTDLHLPGRGWPRGAEGRSPAESVCLCRHRDGLRLPRLGHPGGATRCVRLPDQAVLARSARRHPAATPGSTGARRGESPPDPADRAAGWPGCPGRAHRAPGRHSTPGWIESRPSSAISPLLRAHLPRDERSPAPQSRTD